MQREINDVNSWFSSFQETWTFRSGLKALSRVKWTLTIFSPHMSTLECNLHITCASAVPLLQRPPYSSLLEPDCNTCPRATEPGCYLVDPGFLLRSSISRISVVNALKRGSQTRYSPLSTLKYKGLGREQDPQIEK